MTANSSFSGTIHMYAPRLVGFEFATSTGTTHKNVLLFVGGLGDGLLTVPYVPQLAKSLDGLGWGLVELLISSSYRGWGAGDLVRDACEIEQAVSYFSKLRGGKIALMGHSTGCQDAIYYLTRYNASLVNSKLAAGILQAPVSDREAMQRLFPERYTEMLDFAVSQINIGRGDEFLPKNYSDLFFSTPITAGRWVSLAKKLGDDDFFSSDIEDDVLKTTFGIVDVPLLVLYSGSDEFVPETVDKARLLGRWKSITSEDSWSPHSGIVEGGKHNLGEGSDSGAVDDAISRVSAFLTRL
ncbi:hypothetical protein V1517DRAFT_319025 [Lipomyces orientalis]|uniref:Uncharacterized protein n=1 Tax=Lipomyces orientalis TaxID=1233043 RepID=A0ACC3TS99_9ASCO